MPLRELIDAATAGRALPHNALAISFDDAYESIYTTAWPRLQAYGWPFTVFVNTDAVDLQLSPYMSWDQLRTLAEAGVAIENHSASHAHLVRHLEQETDAQWQTRITDDIRRAATRITQEIGTTPTLFAYPFGEYSQPLKELVQSLGYVGLAQQSGALGPGTDRLAIPRFPLAGGHVTADRLRLALRSRPLPVIGVDREPADAVPGDDLASVTFELAPGSLDGREIACFSAAGRQLPVTPIDATTLRIDGTEVTGAGRNKLNCTAPVAGEPGAYYWHSLQWQVKNPDGSWYAE